MSLVSGSQQKAPLDDFSDVIPQESIDTECQDTVPPTNVAQSTTETDPNHSTLENMGSRKRALDAITYGEHEECHGEEVTKKTKVKIAFPPSSLTLLTRDRDELFASSLKILFGYVSSEERFRLAQVCQRFRQVLTTRGNPFGAYGRQVLSSLCIFRLRLQGEKMRISSPPDGAIKFEGSVNDAIHHFQKISKCVRFQETQLFLSLLPTERDEEAHLWRRQLGLFRGFLKSNHLCEVQWQVHGQDTRLKEMLQFFLGDPNCQWINLTPPLPENSVLRERTEPLIRAWNKKIKREVACAIGGEPDNRSFSDHKYAVACSRSNLTYLEVFPGFHEYRDSQDVYTIRKVQRVILG